MFAPNEKLITYIEKHAPISKSRELRVVFLLMVWCYFN